MLKYNEYEKSVMNVNPNSFSYRDEETHNTFTVRLTYKVSQETLTFSLFTYIRPEDKDSFLKLDVSKMVSDQLTIAAGLNIFTAKNNYIDREFGMLNDDDNFFIRAKYTF